MSIENNLESIAKSLSEIAEALKQNTTATAQPAPVVQQPLTPGQTQKLVSKPEERQEQAPIAPPAFPNAQALYTAPPTQGNLPFSDPNGCRQYLLTSYQTLEAKAPGTGGNIQRVIESLGVQNVNDIQPASYGALYEAVEQLLA